LAAQFTKRIWVVCLDELTSSLHSPVTGTRRVVVGAVRSSASTRNVT